MYPDDELVHRAVNNAGHGGIPQPRWSAVMKTFALGSTYARSLCEQLGFDPDEQVGVAWDVEWAVDTIPDPDPKVVCRECGRAA